MCQPPKIAFVYTHLAHSSSSSSTKGNKTATQIVLIIVAFGRGIRQHSAGGKTLGASWSYHLSDKRADDSPQPVGLSKVEVQFFLGLV